MNTEITDREDGESRGWVCYDAACRLCAGGAGRFGPLLARHGFTVIPLQAPAVRAILNVSEAELLKEMRVITRSGAVVGGADAILHLARAIPWGWPLFLLACIPGMKAILRAFYRWFAGNRYCIAGACELKNLPGSGASTSGAKRRSWMGVLPLFVMTPLAVVLCRGLPGWVCMWVIVFALFAGCKWLSLYAALAKGSKPSFARALAYCLAWPGMNANAFLARKPDVEKPRAAEWLQAAGKTVLGAIVLWFVARRVTGYPIAAAWVAMIGVMFVLHFGLLHALSLAWRRAGVDAEPLMRAPALAGSLAEFWGARWNTGFHKLANDFVFVRLFRRIGTPAATMLVFLASGLIHDLVISLPAGGGYGLPTAYFLLQGAGVLFERTRLARRWGLRRGWRGWLFMTVLTAGPAFWLFHPTFLSNVMIPFLRTLHAI